MNNDNNCNTTQQLLYQTITMCQQRQPTPATKPTNKNKLPELKLLKKKKKKKQVCFGAVQEQFLKPFPRDLAKGDLFYLPYELQAQKDADIEAKREAVEGNNDAAQQFVDTDDLCFRGLEHVLTKTARRERIQAYVVTVLDVYMEQRELGYIDNYELFIVSRSHSRSDRKQALRMGKVDAEEASRLHHVLADDSKSSTKRAPPSSSRRSKQRAMKKWVSGTFQRMKSSKTSTSIRRN